MMQLARAWLVVLILLTSVGAASADGAWVLWSRIADPMKNDRWLDWWPCSALYPPTNANDSSGNGRLAMTVRRHGS
jgi:hypothetical protein